jgi:hypothetical protein
MLYLIFLDRTIVKESWLSKDYRGPKYKNIEHMQPQPEFQTNKSK